MSLRLWVKVRSGKLDRIGLVTADGVAVGASVDPTNPPFIYANSNNGFIARADLSTNPPTQINVLSGASRGDFVAVLKGLKADEEIVGTGVFKLRNGMVVTINNELAPKPELDPNPADT